MFLKNEGVMKMNDLKTNENIFESIKHIDEFGMEFWYARELKEVLNYKEWRKFSNVINNAIIACNKSNVDTTEQFVSVDKLSTNVNGGIRRIEDYKLSRYACYLIAQNADPRKEVVALAQTYFAIQTRLQELSEKDYNQLSEDEKRLFNRMLTKKGNYSLNQTAKKAGVKNFDKFHNAGYRGLYNGETADDIARRKGLRYREEILDNMGSDELIANLFRISQTNQKLKRENIKGENNANIAHYNVGRKVRQTIKELGGTMPEDLPTPNKSLKKLEKETKLLKGDENNEQIKN